MDQLEHPQATVELLPQDDGATRVTVRSRDAGAFDTLLSIAPEDNVNLLEWVQAELAARVFEQAGGDPKEAARRLGATQAALRKALEFRPPAENS